MIAPRKDRRQRSSDPKNPRSKEDKSWRHCTQIMIEPGEFPANIKPAALIIGTKGSNHARLQDESGCCIQLRGVGISSPGTPGSNEPLHLFVKYDEPEQLAKLNAALRQLIHTAFLRAGSAAEPVVKPTAPPTNPIECFYSVHLLLHSLQDLTTDNLADRYLAFYGWPIDARFQQLGGGSIARSLSMISPLVALTDLASGARLVPGTLADPRAVYAVSPIHPLNITIAELREIINQRPQAPPETAAPAPAPDPGPPPPRVVQPKIREPTLRALAALPPPLPERPEDLIVKGLHALLQELHRVPPLGLGLDANTGMPLVQLCESFTQRTGIAVNATALGFKNIMDMITCRCPRDVMQLWQPPSGEVMIRLAALYSHPQ